MVIEYGLERQTRAIPDDEARRESVEYRGIGKGTGGRIAASADGLVLKGFDGNMCPRRAKSLARELLMMAAFAEAKGCPEFYGDA